VKKKWIGSELLATALEAVFGGLKQVKKITPDEFVKSVGRGKCGKCGFMECQCWRKINL